MSLPDVKLLIIGGGVHGTFLSHALSVRARLSPDDIRVLDPFAEPLHYWHRFTAACGMKYLRSPSSHNMELDFRSLRRWARERSGDPYGEFIEPYARPSLTLFNLHTGHVLQEHSLRDLRIQGRALSIEPANGKVTVRYASPAGESHLTARNVVLALSRAEQPRYPDWAPALIRQGAPVSHVFSATGGTTAAGNSPGETVVVGGGVTAVQLALSLGQKTGHPVHILSRHEPRVRMFDSNPCFIGPKCISGFRATTGYDERRRILTRERYSGSLPPYVGAELSAARGEGRIEYSVGIVRRVELEDGCVRMTVQTERAGDTRVRTIEATDVHLATGFETNRPGGALIDDLAGRYRLPVAPCGYPVPAPDLHWGHGVYLAGTLAELELGPASLNIIGAHNAAKLMAQSL